MSELHQETPGNGERLNRTLKDSILDEAIMGGFARKCFSLSGLRL